MTKYVLNSGGIKNQLQLKKQFHNELIKGLGNKPKFLMCNFAQAREYWEEKFPNYCRVIEEDLPAEVKPSFKLAMPDTFEEQCRSADVIYIHGGDDILLKFWLNQFDLARLFEGKVVATNSASSDILSTHFWPCDWRFCHDGLGILPIKFIAHYESDFGYDDPRGPVDWSKGKKDLAEYGDTGLPIYALKEGEYVVFNV